VGPATAGYIDQLLGKLRGLGFGGQLMIMAGNGGVMSPEQAQRAPVHMILSGPAAGPTAARHAAEGRSDADDGIVIDMGGTSFDVSVIRGGRVATSAGRDVNRYRLAVPMLDIHTVGAGGGSVAWIDEVGLLQVGPKSAGAIPGPAAYRRGGLEPTVTDANLVIGLLDPAAVLGGSQGLSLTAARRSMNGIARRLHLSIQEVALGIRQVANGSMTAAIREVTMGRGLDPRDLPLIVGGGAGALHAADLAASLGIDTVVIPSHAGVLCALGMALSDVRYENVIGIIQPLHRVNVAEFRRSVRHAGDELAEKLADIREEVGETRLEIELEARYVGQFHELVLQLTPAQLDRMSHRDLLQLFHKAHQAAYGFTSDTAEMEIVAVRVRLIGTLKQRSSHLASIAGQTLAQSGTRRVYGARRAGQVEEVPVYKPGPPRTAASRRSMPSPALVDLPTTTIYVPPDWSWRVEDSGDLLMLRHPASDK
jgi:N-methylhydantoinase A